MLKNRISIALILIVLLGSFFRLYKLGAVPKGLYVDEVSLGYNAYSILTSGKDEYGISFPLSFRAYGEYKLPGYIYFSVPFIALFGLSAFSVRLLSAVSGILGILGMYLLVYEMFKSEHEHKIGKLLGLSAAFLFAITPWNIHLSRGAFETNLALTLIIYAIYLFYKFIATNSVKWGIISAILFSLSFYTYNAERLFVPSLLIALFAFHLKMINKKLGWVFMGVFVAMSIPALLGLVIGSDSNRAREVFELGNKEHKLGALMGFLQKFLTHFSSDFLFFNGDFSTRNSLKEMGVFLLPQLPLLIAGIFKLTNYSRKSKIILLALFLLAPVSAALTTPVPHALRAYTLVIPMTILSALGLVGIFEIVKKPVKPFFAIFFICVLSYSILTYTHVYYKHYAIKASWDWDEEKSVMAEYVTAHYGNSKRIIIECDTLTVPEYIKFFNATLNKETVSSKYFFVKTFSDIKLQSGDIVAIYGFRFPPTELKNVKELKMSNHNIGYKVGEWVENEI
jgi:4-amino-4-deoxy-L-arabinose transferase-like glycosyltransferase